MSFDRAGRAEGVGAKEKSCTLCDSALYVVIAERTRFLLTRSHRPSLCSSKWQQFYI